ncbi:MAG TPA: ribonuclease R [Betaproteobacteria bacterium]|nr:ribonuclease R [Betaproteobacteria bacterium]
MKKPLRLQDPYLDRERETYANPLPSREFILQVLTAQGVPVRGEGLVELLDIGEEELDFFHRRLRAMERDGQIMRNRKNALCIVDKLDLIKGRVEGHADGFGFLAPDDGSSDLFLSPKEMRQVLHGDIVMARESGMDRRGRREGRIVEVLERANRRVIGRLLVEHGIYMGVAENKRINQDILIPAGADMGAAPGQVIIMEIIEQPSRHAQPIGRVVEVLGNYTDPGMEIDIALRKYDLPRIFPEEVNTLSSKLPKKVRKMDLKGREDIRHLPLVTIDGETARDFDDAVYCEKQGRGYRLLVAIADVSHYVQPEDALDKEALLRGNSIYFPRRVIPMLPEALSNGLCSLNPQVDRLCMACDMIVSASGAIKSYRFYPTVIFSHARLTYTEVADMLAHPEGRIAKQHGALLPHLQQLHRLFNVLLKARAKRGAIDFETIETQMVFNDQGKIERIVPVQRNDAHRLIEECMLAANVCASDYLQTHGHPALYRIHEGPTAEKLENLRQFLNEFGLGLSGGDDPHAKDYAKLLAKIKDRPDAQLLQTVMLRSLQQAVYSPENTGHFGLAYESYTHFTSPIRRYPDLLIHRAIKTVLQGKKPHTGGWAELGVRCSMTERRADEATRSVENWLKAYFMQDKLGESFYGTISGVTGFGVFVALDDIYAEGLVHITDLGNDYFHFDPAKYQLLGERSARRFRLGDRLHVKVMRVDLETARVDFALAADLSAPSVGTAPSPRRAAERQPAAGKGAKRKTALAKKSKEKAAPEKARRATVKKTAKQKTAAGRKRNKA